MRNVRAPWYPRLHGSASMKRREWATLLVFGVLAAVSCTRSILVADSGGTSAGHGGSYDALGGPRTVVRRVYLTEQMAGFDDWTHLRTVLRVESEMFDARGRRIAHDNRYYIASLPACRLTAAQWLLLVRHHWGVENNFNHTLDTAFEEDDRPWIESDPRGMVVVALLRRLAYNVLTLFRSVTQRSDERRATPWLDLLRWFYNAILSATDADLDALRPRPLARAP